MNLEELNKYIMNQQQSTIRGLHTCRPSNVPNVGQIKCFQIIEQPTRSGDKTYTKIKSGKPEEGGQFYMVMSAEKTDYSDQHGNISLNLELEPAAHAPVPVQQKYYDRVTPQGHPDEMPPQSSVNGPPARQNAAPVVSDTPRQHLMRAANLYCLCIDAVDTVIAEKYRAKNVDLHQNPELRQAAVSTLFIDAQRCGYVQHMPDSPSKSKSEPY